MIPESEVLEVILRKNLLVKIISQEFFQNFQFEMKIFE